jgi:hypothetical protein
MDSLQDDLAKLRRDANLSQSIADVDKIIQQLEKARGTIEAGECAHICHETDKPLVTTPCPDTS